MGCSGCSACSDQHNQNGNALLNFQAMSPIRHVYSTCARPEAAMTSPNKQQLICKTSPRHHAERHTDIRTDARPVDSSPGRPDLMLHSMHHGLILPCPLQMVMGSCRKPCRSWTLTSWSWCAMRWWIVGQVWLGRTLRARKPPRSWCRSWSCGPCSTPTCSRCSLLRHISPARDYQGLPGIPTSGLLCMAPCTLPMAR